MIGETEPPVSIEEEIMIAIGFGDRLDEEVAPGVTARHFLDAYPEGSEHRDRTENELYYFADLTPDHPDYEPMRQRFQTMLGTYLNGRQ